MISYMEKVFQESAKPQKLSKYSLLRFIVLISLLQTFLIEAIQRESVINTLYWLTADFHLYLINSLIVLIINLLFLALLGSLQRMFFISTIAYVLLSAVNVVKKQFLGEPLLPWDFSRIDQVINLLPKISGQIWWIFVLIVVLFSLIIFISKKIIPPTKLSWTSRLCFVVCFLIVIPLLIFYRHTPLQTAFEKADIEHIFWVQSENSLVNGFLLGFMMNLEDTMIFQPEGYSEQRMNEIVSTTASPRDPQSIRPNVILILSEAFWDPVSLPEVTFSQDPIPFFRKLSSQSIAGTLVSPVFGGSTANVEFEVLTGLSTCFLPQGSIPYQQYIEKPVPSLPQILKSNGYDTMAIHPYHDWFYKRNKVYPLLGIDHFFSLEDFQCAEIKGDYISDLEVSKKIIEQIKSASNPAFILGITMQNHGPYPDNRYEENSITVAGTLSTQAKLMLETYAQGLKDADNALLYLVEQLQETSEPTILIFFGDHLPYLGKDYLVYKETGFIKESENKWTTDEALKMKSTPYMIWSNYILPVTQEKQLTSAQYLSLQILDTIQIPDNPVFSFGRNFADKLPVYNKTLCMDNNYQHIDKKTTDLKDLEQEYHLLVYDNLFGEQYLSDLIKDSVAKN